jgi:dolichyl-phosphate beta-glucosyltransferase
MAPSTSKTSGEAPWLSIIVPAFNEERRIGPTLEAIGAYLDKADYSSEILVVDDGSSDRTVEEARSARPKARIVSNEVNRGKGFSVCRGMAESRGEIVLFSDADLSTPIEEVETLLSRIRDGADVAIGSRALRESRIERHQNALREMAGRIFNGLLRLLTGLPFHDTQCGFKAFRRPVVNDILERRRIEGWGFDVELILIALRRGYRVEEAPVRWINSPDSRLRIWRDAPKMFLDLLRVRWTDLRGRYR